MTTLEYGHLWTLSEQVAAFCARPGDKEAENQALKALPIVMRFLESYTRGQGFGPGPHDIEGDLAAVLVSVTARLITTPHVIKVGDEGDAAIPILKGWTTPERAILHAYRRRTA